MERQLQNHFRTPADFAQPSELQLAPPSRRAVLTAVGTSLFAPAVWAQKPLRNLVIPISSTSFASASVRAAVEMGCFAEHGLNITTPVMESGSNVTSSLISGNIQVILGGPGEQVAAHARGIPVVLLTNCYWGQSGTLILSKEIAEKSGVSPTASLAERFKVLAGLPIASVSATSALTASFRGASEKTGTKLNFVYMGQPTMVAALESGAIKGYIASAPIWGPSVVSGRGVEWISAPKGELPDENVPRGATGFNAMRSFAEANPDLIRQVLDSYRTFSNILTTKPDAVRAAFGRIYPSVDPAAMDILFNAEHRAWIMRDVTVADMQHEIDFVKASGAPIPGLDKVDPAAMLYAPPK
jgi:ABC-type nitrate/sulfonate/bicarbonate transport system substrate-binding protein